MEEKPFGPSKRKLEKARKSGEVAFSSLLISSLSVLGSLGVLLLFGTHLIDILKTIMSSCLSGKAFSIKPLVIFLFFFGCTPVAIILIVGFLQTHGLFAFKNLLLRQRKKKKTTLVDTFLVLIKLILLSFPLTVYLCFVRQLSYRSLMLLAVSTSLLLVMLGCLDWIYRRWQFNQQQRMSSAEKKQEQKEIEGSPIKKRRN